jgi:hypothetical protein
MPAVTFSSSTTQSSQKERVRIAASAVSPMAVERVQFTAPGGIHPGGGTRTVNTPNIMKAQYATPSTANASATPIESAVRKWAIRARESGAPTSDPPPKPMIASPVAKPGRSGNHLMSVETGEMYPRPNPIPPRTPYPR